MKKIESDLLLLKWMTELNLVLTLAILWRVLCQEERTEQITRHADARKSPPTDFFQQDYPTRTSQVLVVASTQ